MSIRLFLRKWKRFGVHIVFPAVLAGALFFLSVFLILIPETERQLLERKKETIRELTHASWSILAEYHKKEANGELTREQAQREAADRIERMRYGDDGKDYFWITDMHPRMVMHPYRSDLNGQDLTNFEDLRGKKLFVDFVNAVRKSDEGYSSYYWQWKDDPKRIVPKLSHVRAFRPWQWVVGTGIYTEDVKDDIARIERRLIWISLGIAGAVSLLLFYIAKQSLDIERRRAQAEEGLKETSEKYRALVEAATEGTLMVLDGKCAYSNKTMLDMLGYEDGELAPMDAESLLAASEESAEDRGAREALRTLLDGGAVSHQFEARLRRKDGSFAEVLLAATRISFAGKNGFILTAKDLARPKEMEAALDQMRRQYKSLAGAIRLGVFRSTWGRKTRMIEANPAARRIFAIAPGADLAEFDWLERIAGEDERTAFVRLLSGEEVVENSRMGLIGEGGRPLEISISAVLVKEENGEAVFCEGIIEDITERQKTEAERDSLIAQLQSSLFFLQEPILQACGQAPSCDLETSIARAAAQMTRARSSAILITGPEGVALGIATDHDFRERIVAGGVDPSRPIREIMSAPLASISGRALVYEAILLMQEKGVRHLVVKDDSGAVRGIVRHRELFHYQNYSSMILTNAIRHARGIEDIIEAHDRLPRLVKALIDSGIRARNINRVITNASDTIAEKLIAMAIERLGAPPVRFAFLALGSEGREEQTLLTDQDNGILYEDPPPDQAEAVAAYFEKMSESVCAWLDQAGYAFCQGGVMAKNPRWRQPLSRWKEYFSSWIHNANPQELLELNMFFDFRCVSGDRALAAELRAFIYREIELYPPFLLHFAQNALLYKPPIGIFGNILTESSGEGPQALNLKDAMMPVVNYARLYALRHRIEETHTLDRLGKLHETGSLSRETFEDLLPAYETMMRMRLDRQAIALNEKRKPSNWINQRDWTHIEQATLKQAFSLIATIRKKIGYDFLGMA